MKASRILQLTGDVRLNIIRNNPPPIDSSFAGVLRAVGANFQLKHKAYSLLNFANIWRGLRKIAIARAFRIPHFYGALYLKVFRASGEIDDYGLVSLRVVTDAGVGYVVDAFQNLTELENMKYHAFGTGTASETVSQTALQTELTTQYSTANTRPTGSTTEAAANIFRTVATLTVSSAVGITEHGIMNQAATGGGVMLDRSVFAVVNLSSGESAVATYDLTFNAGG